MRDVRGELDGSGRDRAGLLRTGVADPGGLEGVRVISQDQTIDEAVVSVDFARDPYPTYRRLVEMRSPVYSEARGGWLLASYDAVAGSLRDWGNFSSEGRVSALIDHFGPEEMERLEGLASWAALKGIIHADPPDHTRFRRLFARSFTRRVVEQLRPHVADLVTELLDRVEGRSSIDVVRDLAQPLPAAVISEMLVVPSEDRDRFIAWSDAALALQGNRRTSLEVAMAASDAYAALQTYFAELIGDRRANPIVRDDTEDLLTSLIAAGDGDDEISSSDLIQSCITLLMGGFETTTSLISNTMVLLLRHPETRRRLDGDGHDGDGDALERTIEESLRFESPIQTITRRVARDCTIEGSSMKEGDLAIAIIGAANRDPAQFDDPDRFDIDRTDNRHITFGHGIHFCLGAPLARLEAPIAVKGLLTRFPELRLADDEIEWNVDKTVTRCPAGLVLDV